MSQERRQAPRVDERVTVAITESGAAVQAETRNLSTAGAYCTLDRFIAPMTKLQLEYELLNGTRRVRIRCSGVVVRVEPVVSNQEHGQYNIAIFFTELTEHDRSAISQFVRQRLSAQPSTR